jgi:hypothetical protein
MILGYVAWSDNGTGHGQWTEAVTMDPMTPPLPEAGQCDARKPSVTEILQRLADTQERLAASLIDRRPQGQPEGRRD